MLRRAIDRLRAFSSDDGVVSVEFSMIAAPFIGLVIAILQSFMAQVYITNLDRAVQRFASELRSGISITKDSKSLDLMQALIKDRLCPQIPPLMGLNCAKMQVSLYKGAGCVTATGTTSCWNSLYSDMTRAVRKPIVYVTQPDSPTFDYGAAGDSQYLVVFYPLPLLSPIWDTIPGVLLDGKKVRGLMSTATWINDPSVGVF